MNWNEIIEKSFSYIRKNKFLWWLGILAALTEGGASFSNYSGGNWSSGDNPKIGQMADSVSGWITGHIDIVVIALAALFVFSLAILYISYSARAGLIYSINSLESDKTEVNFGKAFSAGQKYFWRFLGLTLIIALLVFLAIAVFVGLIISCIFLVIASLWFLIAAIPLGLMLILALVVTCFYLNLILLIASRKIVISGNGVMASIKASRQTIRKNLGQVLIGWLINFGLSLAVGVALAVALAIIGGMLFVIGIGIYFIGKWTGVIIYAIPVGLALLAAMLFATGVINGYFSAYWTLVYTKLKG